VVNIIIHLLPGIYAIFKNNKAQKMILMKKTFGLIVLVLMTAILASSVLADGGLVIRISDMDMWKMFDEGQQYCAINYKDGVQHMILAIDTAEELTGDSAVWMFPVPANPDEIDIDIFHSFPFLAGVDLSEKASESMSDSYTWISATQVYTIPPLAFIIGSRRVGSGKSLSYYGAADSAPSQSEVVVYESVEKWGLTTELISATDRDAFNGYLAGKNLDLPDDFDRIIEEYIGKDYAFIVTWVSNVTALKQSQEANSMRGRGMDFKGNTLGVFISFPTDKIYYPLKPTSVYGNKPMPVVIYVMGFVTPEIYQDISTVTEVTYYEDSYVSGPKELKEFFKGYQLTGMPYSTYALGGTYKSEFGFAITNLAYTKIKLDFLALAYTQDLWIKDEAPKKIVFYQSIIKHKWRWAILIFIVISCFSSMLAGAIKFRGKSPALLRFFFFGLWNFLSLIGLWIAAYIAHVERRFTSDEALIDQQLTLRTGQRMLIIIPIILVVLSVIFIPLVYLLDLESILNFGLVTLLAVLFMPIIVFIPLVFWGVFKNKKSLGFNALFAGIFILLLLVTRLLFNLLI
jgi:hypothetical protein